MTVTLRVGSGCGALRRSPVGGQFSGVEFLGWDEAVVVLAGDGDLVVGFLELEEGYDALLHELSRYWAGDQISELLLRDSEVLPDLDDAQ